MVRKIFIGLILIGFAMVAGFTDDNIKPSKKQALDVVKSYLNAMKTADFETVKKLCIPDSGCFNEALSNESEYSKDKKNYMKEIEDFEYYIIDSIVTIDGKQGILVLESDDSGENSDAYTHYFYIIKDYKGSFLISDINEINNAEEE